MSLRRNLHCPCGSGKKYKHCHGKVDTAPPSPAESTWRGLRSALDGHPSTMLRFIRQIYGPGAVDEAWDEFVLWDEGGPAFDPRSPQLAVFMPWFFHEWAPDPLDTGVADASLHGRSPTGVLLERRGRRLPPLLARYLEGCLAAPFSFHEILEVEPDRGFRARDVFTGEERDVMERSASRTMRPGDLFFGQVVTSSGITVLEACSPFAMGPGEKLGLLQLRERMTDGGSRATVDVEELRDWALEVRDEYLALVERITNPPPPDLRNTDGEPIAFHRLTFEVPSAQEAFDALKHLALDETDDDLLESADVDAEGRVRRVSFVWKAAGNEVHAHWENTVLGHLELEERRLEANVNSAGRAARLRRLVESACPDARHVGTEVESLEEARARLPDVASPPDDADPALEHPEVLEHVRELLAAHYERWVDEPIPALGGMSPMQAVRDRTGREKVEALVAQLERDGRRMDPPLDEAITRALRERLGIGG